MSTRSIKLENTKRVNAVYKMLLIGVDRAEILQYTAENYNIAERSTDDLIAKANAIYNDVSKTLREVEFGKALVRLNNLYARSLKVQDFKTCLSVQKEINSLIGLNAPIKQIIHIGLIQQLAQAIEARGESASQYFEDTLREFQLADSSGDTAADT